MRFEVGRGLILVLVWGLIEGGQRVWRPDSDLVNPDNWVGGKLSTECQGVNFAGANTAPVYIKQLITAQILLPRDGELQILEGGYIEFMDTKKCINLKPINYHSWYDPNSWVQSDNEAIPHKQRIPCTYDRVVFPKIIHTRVSENLSSTINVAGVKFGEDQIGWTQLDEFRKTDVGRDVFYNPLGDFGLQIKDNACQDPHGCVCHQEFVPCPNLQPPKPNCLSPILPEEFCAEICGAYITFKPNSAPNLETLNRELEHYTSDTHASRVKDYLGQELTQVVFTEKTYSGSSLKEAQRFLEYLKSEHVTNPQMLQSGFVVSEGAGAWSIVLGTLIAVCLFFAIIMYLYKFPIRWRPNRGSLATPFFARFDTADEHLVLGSEPVVKSFDNPMFGHVTPDDDEE